MHTSMEDARERMRAILPLNDEAISLQASPDLEEEGGALCLFSLTKVRRMIPSRLRISHRAVRALQESVDAYAHEVFAIAGTLVCDVQQQQTLQSDVFRIAAALAERRALFG